MSSENKKYFGAIVIVLAAALLLAFITYALMYATHRIESTATVKVVGVGVYEDVNCTVPVMTIDWGLMDPNETKNFTAYIQNESNVPINLTMYTEEWLPENASDFITLSWDYDDSDMTADSVVQVSFSLAVSEEIEDIDSFTFVIVIVGAG
jgi:hypothetical protein